MMTPPYNGETGRPPVYKLVDGATSISTTPRCELVRVVVSGWSSRATDAAAARARAYTTSATLGLIFVNFGPGFCWNFGLWVGADPVLDTR
jgi:hypothetical protein